MNGWDFFKVYQPIHLHFTTSYNVLKYGGKSKSVNFDSFTKRNDKGIFDSWSSEFQSKEKAGRLCIANFVYSNENWLYDEKTKAKEAFTHWTKIRQSITKVFNDELDVSATYLKRNGGSLGEWDDFIRPTASGKKPPLMQLAQVRKISAETICIIDNISDHSFIGDWHSTYDHDPLISDWCFKLDKYKPFCNNLINNPQQILEAKF